MNLPRSWKGSESCSEFSRCGITNLCVCYALLVKVCAEVFIVSFGNLYRNARLFADICAACSPRTRLCVASGLTTEAEYLHTCTVKQWRQTPPPDLGKTPTIFALYAG